MLNGVHAGFGGDADGCVVDRVRSDFLVHAVSLFDDQLHLLLRKHARPRVDDYLDTVRSVVKGLAYRTPRFLDTTDDDVLLCNDLLCFGLHGTKLTSRSRQRASRSDNTRADDPTFIDRVAQRHVTIQP